MVIAVIGGTVLDGAFAPFVALATADGGAFCSGVLVGPAHVLTAAHCVADGVAAGEGTVRVGDDELGWASVDVHPDAAGPDEGHDLAVITLDGDAPVAPAPLASSPPEVGDELALYGFGASSEGGDDAGVLRGTHVEVVEVDELVLRSFGEGTNVCSGDSGGPAVQRVDDGWWVVGVNTFVDPTCLGGMAGTTRIDVHLDWLAEVVGSFADEPAPGAFTPRSEERGCSTAPRAGSAALLALVVARGRRRLRHSTAEDAKVRGGTATSRIPPRTSAPSVVDSRAGRPIGRGYSSARTIKA